MVKRHIFVYTEDAPVAKDVVAKGMSRAGTPLLRAILDEISEIVVFNRHRWYGLEELDPVLAPLCHIIPRPAVLFCKIMRGLGAIDLADQISTSLCVRWLRRSSADILFSYIGTDAGLLARSSELARRAGKQHVVYLVDDFLASLKIAGSDETTIRKTKERVSVPLRGAKTVFAITDGLRDQLYLDFGVSATTLPLAFETDIVVAPPAKAQITYTGSINFLYSQGLRDLFDVVSQIRNGSGLDLRVRLICSESQALKAMGELPPFVSAAHEPTSSGLANEIAAGLCAFLPYSFSDHEKAMVTTSFPSKSLEYLAFARSIVVYGPSYSVTARLFLSKGLPSVITNRKELESIIWAHIDARPNHSTMYREYLESVHSLASVSNVIRRGLSVASE